MSIKINQWLCVVILSATSLSAFASESQYWTSLQIISALKNDFSLYGELINRYSDDNNEFVTRSNRLGVGYQINSDLAYTFMIENRDTNSDANDEIRFIHQLQQKMNFDFANISARLRLENREFSNTPVFAMRGRLQLRADFENAQLYQMTPFASYEHFYIFNDTRGRPEGSTERRSQIGVSFPVSMIDAKVDLMYLDRAVERASGLGLNKTTSTYSIANLVLKWSY